MAIRRGNDRDNTLTGTKNDDEIYGRGGNDKITAGDGDDLVRGGDGNDRLSGQKDNDTLFGDSGEDNLNGGPGDDAVDGGRNADLVQGGEGDDTLTGGRGADTFIINRDDGQDTILDFGDGNDKISINGFSGIKDFLSLDIKVVGNNSVLDLGFVENGIESEQVLTVLDETSLTANDFLFPAGKVVVAAFKTGSGPATDPAAPPGKASLPPFDGGDSGLSGREQAALGVMGVQDSGFTEIA